MVILIHHLNGNVWIKFVQSIGYFYHLCLSFKLNCFNLSIRTFLIPATTCMSSGYPLQANTSTHLLHICLQCVFRLQHPLNVLNYQIRTHAKDHVSLRLGYWKVCINRTFRFLCVTGELWYVSGTQLSVNEEVT